jgi:hypothetical protein
VVVCHDRAQLRPSERLSEDGVLTASTVARVAGETAHQANVRSGVNGNAPGPSWGSSGVSIELVPSVYLSSELIVIDTQTVDRPGVLHLTYLVLPVNRLHLVATT